MPNSSPLPDDEERLALRDVPLLLMSAAPIASIPFGLIALGAYLPLETRLRMVEKMGVERALFWQGAGWVLVIWVWWRLFVKAELFMSGAFPSTGGAMISALVAVWFVGWLVFAAGTLCGTGGW